MPLSTNRRSPGWLGVLGVVGMSVGLLGCPGTLDPSLLTSNGGGGTGATGAGGSGPAGGSGGGSNCVGALDGATIITSNCTIGGCHNPGDAPNSAAGLDLTVDAMIGMRLVGVMSPGNTAAGSMCAGNTEPYLKPNSSPVSGLLIDKINPSPPCGLAMPYPGLPSQLLSAAQVACVEQWAETLVMAAQ
jgi:hypothetical protein